MHLEEVLTGFWRCLLIITVPICFPGLSFPVCPSETDVYLTWGSDQGGEDLRLLVDGQELGSIAYPVCDPDINYDDCFTRSVTQQWAVASSHVVGLTLYPFLDSECDYRLFAVDGPFPYFEDSDCAICVVPDPSNPPSFSYDGHMQAYQTNSFSFHVVRFRLIDAQGFQPQWQEGDEPTLNLAITDDVDSGFDRVGALTDGASLVVVQVIGGENLAGFTLTLTDPDVPTNDAVQLGSLWHGDSDHLPPLPAAANNAGSASVILDGNDTALFYRPPAAWWFGKDRQEKTIRIELYSPTAGWICSLPFTLHKPPLVLVHGWISGPSRWDDFLEALQAADIQVDHRESDYHDQSAYGLDVIYSNVPATIHDAIANMRQDQRIAATRVDVVAHSMGGLLTRWYMTPGAGLPNNADRSANANPAPLFKTSLITSPPRAPENEFKRPDDFGIGDIRRFITLGTPHTGTDWSRAAIRMVNNGISRRSEPGDIHRRVWSGVEQILGFHAIALTDSGDAGPEGMSLIDLAAYGTHPQSGSPAPPKSVALNALAPVPVAYAPIEGIAAGGSLWNSFETGMFRIIAGFTLTAPAPSDLRTSNSDALVPSASARNLNASDTNRVINGVVHFELPGPNPRAGQLFEQLLGSDESLFIQP